MSNPLAQLREFGQSPWLDSIRRGMIDSGELEAMRDSDGLGGITSNPAIFEKAVSDSDDYRGPLKDLVEAGVTDPEVLYERIATADIRAAADVLEPLYRRTDGRDGFVSLEVSPRLARDTDGTVAEARRLWSEVDRPNAMIKVPATPEGIPAIETLVAEGLNINVTLLFSRAMYGRAAEAYLRGLEHRLEAGRPVDRVAGVASFFLSRIDAKLEETARARRDDGDGRAGEALAEAGNLAVANAKMAYRDWQERFSGERWQRLAGAGARPQWLLWASTGTKDPGLSDVHYVEPLIGPGTVATLPPDTYEAFRDHGRPGRTLDTGLEEAERVLAAVEGAGIALDDLTDQLLDEGVDKFASAFDRLLEAVQEVRHEVAPA
ncbi:MAG TPA: transaldolase [Gammaproteobacteria bacterium]|nr:transaldolase [Gammaproteobacteria bacterium]